MRHDSLFTISPDAPFLATLAERVLDGTLLGDWPRSGPFWLSDVTIILPTRRARLALANAFLARGHRLLPDLRTLGGEAEDEAPFLPPYDAPPLPIAVTPLARTLKLAQLVEAWAQTGVGQTILATPPNAAEILSLSASLGQLIDDIAIEGIRVEDVVAIPPEDLAANWAKILEFLGIALKTWPEILAEHGLSDAAPLRNERLRREAAAIGALYGERPVIAAGSTGSIPATADLLAAIADLKRGHVVLPGLDASLDAEAHARLLAPEAALQGHPQYGLARLLRRLGTSHAAVRELGPATPSPRLHMVRQALLPPDETIRWVTSRAATDLDAATAGLSVIAARTVDEEALALAIAARQRLADGRTVGIVSPDQSLSRRIAAELRRFDIAVDDAAGTPLFQSPAGRLARLALAAAVSGFSAVDLVALCQNRAVDLGLGRAEVSRRAMLIEMGVLRGQRPTPGIAGIKVLIAANRDEVTKYPPRRLSRADATDADELLDRLATALAPLTALVAAPDLTVPAFATALDTAVTALIAGGRTPPGHAEFRNWATEAVADPASGPRFRPVALDGVLAALMAGRKFSEARPARDDIAIWGRLEARLQNPDCLILAGLNEDIWPEPADPGPWLSRGMRIAAGLEPPERQLGLAAHDFEMALGNSEVILAYAERRGASPALPSRFIQRLDAFLGEEAAKALRRRGSSFIEMARRLDLTGSDPKPAQRPMPRPPAADRPRRLSITEAETLLRSPYDLYAKHVLRLAPLPPLGAPPDSRERGIMVHDVFGRFVEEGGDFAAPDAADHLMALARTAFAGLDAIAERHAIWLARFAVAAEQLLAYERERSPRVLRRHAEIRGKWPLALSEPFLLTGRADRIDVMADGTLELLDFKTGSIPAPATMRAFEAPQLPLEAAMAAAGGFADITPAPSSALRYLKIGLGPEALKETIYKAPDGMPIGAVADEMARLFQGHVERLLLSDELPMGARIYPVAAQRYAGDYDHLARTAEWTLSDGDEEP